MARCLGLFCPYGDASALLTSQASKLGIYLSIHVIIAISPRFELTAKIKVPIVVVMSSRDMQGFRKSGHIFFEFYTMSYYRATVHA